MSGSVRWTELTPSEWRDQDEMAADLKTTGTVQPYEKQFVRKDGTRIAEPTRGALFYPIKRFDFRRHRNRQYDAAQRARGK